MGAATMCLGKVGVLEIAGLVTSPLGGGIVATFQAIEHGAAAVFLASSTSSSSAFLLHPSRNSHQHDRTTTSNTSSGPTTEAGERTASFRPVWNRGSRRLVGGESSCRFTRGRR